MLAEPSDSRFVYGGDISISDVTLKEIPEAFLYFKEIKGSLNFNGCINLQSLHNLRNLRKVGNWIDFRGCENLQSLHGLENLEYIGLEFGIRGCTNLQSFKGLNPFVNIVGNSSGHKIYPPLRNQEFLDYQESEQVKKVFEFVESL